MTLTELPVFLKGTIRITRDIAMRFFEEYKYSSALFYKTSIDNLGFLTHYRD